MCISSDCMILKIYISEGNVATQLRWGGIFNNRVITNFPRSVSVKELLKSVNIWQRYRETFSGTVGTFLWFAVYLNISDADVFRANEFLPLFFFLFFLFFCVVFSIVYRLSVN